MKFAPVILLAAASTLALSAHALTPFDAFGKSAADVTPEHTVTIDSNTHYITVKQYDVVKITDGQHSVVWQFDGLKTIVPLSEVLPSAPNAEAVLIYVQSQPAG